jgi:hypothetical protein
VPVRGDSGDGRALRADADFFHARNPHHADGAGCLLVVFLPLDLADVACGLARAAWERLSSRFTRRRTRRRRARSFVEEIGYPLETVDPAHAGIHLYQLVPSANLLANADLWTCQAAPWTKFPLGPTNLAVYRHPNDASDANCYLATNCGAPACQAGQSIYQDVAAASVAGKSVAFGGAFAVDGGQGTFDLALLALDAGAQIVGQSTVHVTATTAYAPFAGTLAVPAGAVTLRYQMYLGSTETFRADEMYVTPAP